MQEYASAPPADLAAVLSPEQLGELTAEQQAQLLLTPAPLHLVVNCDGLRTPRPLGVCGFVSYLLLLLLLLRRRGTSVRLSNVHPVLHRCLDQLRLGPLFHLNG